jgi:N-acyl amino acid synthase of PEP-CTERM/exosortase system
MAQGKGFIATCLDTWHHQSCIKIYNDTFELVRAVTDAQRELSFRLRYDVYVAENKFEKNQAHMAQNLEKDSYDNHAAHYLLLQRNSGDAIGTLRVILPDDNRPLESFPLQKQCKHPLLQDPLKAETLFELSRFCVAKKFRKRERDGRLLSSYYDQDIVDGRVNGQIAFFRRRIPYAPAALIRGAFETALGARILEGVWMVDPCHLSSLERIGMEIRALGPHIAYHGGAQPVIFNIKTTLDTMRTLNPYCWEIISDAGRLQAIADNLTVNDWRDRVLEDVCSDNNFQKNSDF